MGKNNKARRAAKARDRRRRAQQRGPGHAHRAGQPNGRNGSSAPGAPDARSEPNEPLFTPEELIDGLVEMAPFRLAAGDRAFADAAVDQLAEMPRRRVLRAAGSELLFTVTLAWESGWQPAELVRHARREGGTVHAALVSEAIAVDHRRHSAADIDPRWAEQVAAIIGEPSDGEAMESPAPDPRRWFIDWVSAQALGPRGEIMTAIELLAVLRSLPELEILIPPPNAPSGAPGASPAAGAGTGDLSAADRQILDRVRNLLAKAESTEFEAEAETFTAKAHELITRHAIDTALLDAARDAGGSGEAAAPITIRLPIDDPYADAKSLLLQIVAEAGRCRSIFHTNLSLSSLIGFAADVRAVELMYTSLLVQGQVALAAAGRNAPAGARTRSRSYRSAFLVAFANRIGQRLVEINEHLVSADDDGRAALPVLRSREAAIDDVLAERFPELTSSPVRGGDDAAGWAGGRMAADNAQLTFADLDADRDGNGAAEHAAHAATEQLQPAAVVAGGS